MSAYIRALEPETNRLMATDGAKYNGARVETSERTTSGKKKEKNTRGETRRSPEAMHHRVKDKLAGKD